LIYEKTRKKPADKNGNLKIKAALHDHQKVATPKNEKITTNDDKNSYMLP